MSKFKKLVEFVLLGDKTHGYNFPNDISKDQAKALSDAIDADPKLLMLVSSSTATAADIWKILGATEAGKAVLAATPNAARFRISGERQDKDPLEQNVYKPQVEGDEESTTPMHRYDTAAQKMYRSGQTNPSFREFFSPDPESVAKYRPEEVSGITFKTTAPERKKSL